MALAYVLLDERALLAYLGLLRPTTAANLLQSRTFLMQASLVSTNVATGGIDYWALDSLNCWLKVFFFL